jgi:metal-responsive CopG/Arc/MetJ family transcriptional regulator
MGYAKVAISIEPELLRKVDRMVKTKRFASRSEAFGTAVKEKLSRLERTRLAEECAKLDPKLEKALADEGLAEDSNSWPAY